MKIPINLNDTMCQICDKPIEPNEPFGWVKNKDKSQKIVFFHIKCYEKIKKKG